jgi:Xaa-Pro aminopeptidase
MTEDSLLLVDSGVETPTDTLPTSRARFRFGALSPRQKENLRKLCWLVRIEAIAPAAWNFVCRSAQNRLQTMAAGLVEWPFCTDRGRYVEAGAHALFFPHGLGHLLGLDVHDMEDLGDIAATSRNRALHTVWTQFFAHESHSASGNGVHRGAGIYFIPALHPAVAVARGMRRLRGLRPRQPYLGFGGVRIEDDVLVTSDGTACWGAGPSPKPSRMWKTPATTVNSSCKHKNPW